MNQDLKNKWVAALRSGQFAQTVGTLQRDQPGEFELRDTRGETIKVSTVVAPVGYCCLGVLCEVIRQEAPDLFSWESSQDGNGVALFEGWEPVDEWSTPYSPTQFVSELESMGHLPGIEIQDEVVGDLIKMNDYGESFDAIADAIEESVPVTNSVLPIQEIREQAGLS